MIRVEIVRSGPGGSERVEVRCFPDSYEAGTWLVEDSYFERDDVLRFTWESTGTKEDAKCAPPAG